MITTDPIACMGEQIRRIVCTTFDEAAARRKIEAVIRETALAMNMPRSALIVDHHFTDELLKLPLKDRAEKLRQRGHRL
jgi:hypothetical protein